MNDKSNLPCLFLVVLGGRVRSSHIELHDVRWVVGNTIEETFPQLRQEWFGDKQGLHIDSYAVINFVDGFEVSLRRSIVKKETLFNKKRPLKSSSKLNSLWFVNLGAYDPNRLSELHEFGLVVAGSANEARRIAKKRWLKDAREQHKDNLSKIDSMETLDDLNLIDNLQGWEIELTPDLEARSQDLTPDWYGYLRIDNE